MRKISFLLKNRISESGSPEHDGKDIGNRQKSLFDDKNSVNRFFMLDLLRFFACVAIVFWHYQYFFDISPEVRASDYSVTALPFYSLFSLFYRSGYCSVQVFWMLSGFVFFVLFSKRIHSKKLSAKTFSVDRFSRLYPLHLLTLLLVAGLFLLIKSATGYSYPDSDLRHFVLNLFLVAYVSPNARTTFNDPIWSMALECIAYALFFIYVRFLKADVKKTVALVVLFWILFKYPAEPIVNPQIFRCCTYFFCGGALFLLLEKLSERYKYEYVYLILSVIFIAGFLFCHKEILMILFLILVFSYPVRLPAKTASFFLFLGNTTYSIYLLHTPLRLSMLYFFKRFLHLNLHEYAYSPVFFIVHAVILFGLSVLSYYFFEVPAKKFIRNLFLEKQDPTKSRTEKTMTS